MIRISISYEINKTIFVPEAPFGLCQNQELKCNFCYCISRNILMTFLIPAHIFADLISLAKTQRKIL